MDPPPRLRKVLSPEGLAKHNIEMMKLRTLIQEKEKIVKKN